MARADDCCGILAHPPLLWFLPETRLLLCSGVNAWVVFRASHRGLGLVARPVLGFET